MYGTYIEPTDPSAAEPSSSSASSSAGNAASSYKPRKKMVLSDLPSASKNTLPKKSVRVEFIYEPRQIGTPSGFDILDDEREAAADALAASLGFIKVGFIFSHPQREDYNFSAREIIQAGQQCLEASQGAFDSPFVVVKVFPESDGNVAFDAFQLTPQCLEMVAEDALLELPDNPGVCAVHETFTAIVEAKAAEVIDNDFFIKRVPIVSHASPLSGGGGGFPPYNRDKSEVPSPHAFKNAMRSVGRSPTTLALLRGIANFHILMYLGDQFGDDGIKDITSILRRAVLRR